MKKLSFVLSCVILGVAAANLAVSLLLLCRGDR